MTAPPVTFASPAAFAVAAALAMLVLGLAVLRRPAFPASAAAFVAAGVALLALAAGGPTWRRAAPGEVVVMVDLSPSTRTARYRDAAALRERIARLLGDRPYNVIAFSGHSGAADTLPLADGALPDRPAEQTVFQPPAAAAVVLFSDARFDLPASAPPTYVVVDPLLESPPDAAVERLEVRGGRLSVTTRNGAGLRDGTVSGLTKDPQTLAAPQGVVTHEFDLPPAPTPTTITARLSGGDAWPENDTLSVSTPPPEQPQRWWVGQRTAPAEGWTAVGASALPQDAAAYLAPSVIVLDNVAAADVSEAQQQRLRQYVRDLGGALVIIGGGRAFAAGEYPGTAIEALSPLASMPPQASRHWVVLVDSSGSMAAAAGPSTRWRVAADAVLQALPSLPPSDVLSVGGFAAEVQWWIRGVAVREAAARGAQSLPPPDARASGPTELRRAIEGAAAAPDAGGTGLAREVLLLTDANAPIPDGDGLVASLRSRNVRLHLLAMTEGGQGLEVLRRIVEQTGGTVLQQADPSAWAAAVASLARAATPELLVAEPARVNFLGALKILPARDVSPWNRTWIKSGATPSAETFGPGSTDSSDPVPMAARWQVGDGQVFAAAFPATAEEVERFSDLVSRPPRDPRLRVNWETGAQVRVTVDATEAGAYLNGLTVFVEVADAVASGGALPRRVKVPLTGPGRYATSFDAPAAPAIGTLRVGDRAVERFALAGRYPREFDRVGNDRPAMRELATRTGGRIVEPSETAPLADLPRPGRELPLTSPVAALGAALVALGLARWRRGS